jgi:hypothetical protein
LVGQFGGLVNPFGPIRLTNWVSYFLVLGRQFAVRAARSGAIGAGDQESRLFGLTSTRELIMTERNNVHFTPTVPAGAFQPLNPLEPGYSDSSAAVRPSHQPAE